MSAQKLRLRPCWFRHPVAVEELTGLLASWQGAYCPGGEDPDAPGDAAAHWHLYGLWPTLLRLHEHAGWAECKPGAHKDRLTSNDPDLSVGLADFIDADVAKRPARTLTLVDDIAEVALARLILSLDDVAAMLEDGEAVAMLPGDPAGPVYLDGTWWSRPPLHATPTYDADGNMELADRFQPVLADDIAAALDEHSGASSPYLQRTTITPSRCLPVGSASFTSCEFDPSGQEPRSGVSVPASKACGQIMR